MNNKTLLTLSFSVLISLSSNAQIPFATGSGGSVGVGAVQQSIDFVGDYNGGLENDWADKFGDRGQFRFDLNVTGIVAVDGYPAYVSPGTYSYETSPVSGKTWAINNLSGGNVVNSVLRGTIQSINFGENTFDAVLLSDGFFNGYGDWNKNGDVTDDKEPLSDLPVGNTKYVLNGKVYVSGTLDQAPTGGKTWNLTYTFGVPDSSSTLMLLGIAFSGMAFVRRRFVA